VDPSVLFFLRFLGGSTGSSLSEPAALEGGQISLLFLVFYWFFLVPREILFFFFFSGGAGPPMCGGAVFRVFFSLVRRKFFGRSIWNKIFGLGNPR